MAKKKLYFSDLNQVKEYSSRGGTLGSREFLKRLSKSPGSVFKGMTGWRLETALAGARRTFFGAVGAYTRARDFGRLYSPALESMYQRYSGGEGIHQAVSRGDLMEKARPIKDMSEAAMQRELQELAITMGKAYGSTLEETRNFAKIAKEGLGLKKRPDWRSQHYFQELSQQVGKLTDRLRAVIASERLWQGLVSGALKRGYAPGSQEFLEYIANGALETGRISDLEHAAFHREIQAVYDPSRYREEPDMKGAFTSTFARHTFF